MNWNELPLQLDGGKVVRFLKPVECPVDSVIDIVFNLFAGFSI